MSDAYDLLADVVVVIRGDALLKETFNRVLGLGSMTQQVRVGMLLDELERVDAPNEVKQFVRLLGNEKLAHQVFVEINRD